MTALAKPVSVTALKFHTLDGHAHQTGEMYAVAADQVENLVAQGMAMRTAEPTPVAPKPSQPIAPLSTADFKA